MPKTDLEDLRLRLDVLVEVVAALARSVPPERTAELQATLTQAVGRRLQGVSLSAKANRAVACDLATLLGAAAPQALRGVTLPTSR